MTPLFSLSAIRLTLFLHVQELNPLVSDKLYRVLNNTDIVLLCDDSDSMAQAISEESTDPFAPKRSTRCVAC